MADINSSSLEVISSSAIAAVDLGSNSFHMIVAEDRKGQLVIIDRIKEMVRLASGLDNEGNLSNEVEQRALACLQRFGQRLRNLPLVSVSAVGTNTLRRTRNSELFLQRAEQALGYPIEIISGIEEARLIYNGVAHSLEPDHKNRLVIDIGGGSTEIIIGEDFTPKMMESIDIGCVSLTRKFFEDGKITPKRVNEARINVLQHMKPVRHVFRKRGWDAVIGASGTIRSAQSVIQALKLARQDGVTFVALQILMEKLKNFENINSIRLSGLSEDRIPVFLGGMIVLSGVCESLEIKQMQVSEGALREGLLYQMLGQRHDSDIRNQSVKSLAERFHADVAYGQRVAQTACMFMQQVYKTWAFDLEKSCRLLNWSSMLHEIGRDIAHSGYHKHSAYIIENADMAGFSQQEQKRIATLVRAHRSKITGNIFDSLNKSNQDMIKRLAVLLRLSVIFNRSRALADLPEIKLDFRPEKSHLVLQIPEVWTQQHPLTLNDLDLEAGYIQSLGVKLKVKTVAQFTDNILDD